jgi:hypothetical protein
MFFLSDNEPPTLEDCESPLPFFINVNLTTNLSSIGPQFSDNSMTEIFVSKSEMKFYLNEKSQVVIKSIV